MPGTLSRILPIVSHLILIITMWGKFDYHLAGESFHEAQRGYRTCPWPRTWLVVELRFKSRLSGNYAFNQTCYSYSSCWIITYWKRIRNDVQRETIVLGAEERESWIPVVQLNLYCAGNTPSLCTGRSELSVWFNSSSKVVVNMQGKTMEEFRLLQGLRQPPFLRYLGAV